MTIDGINFLLINIALMIGWALLGVWSITDEWRFIVAAGFAAVAVIIILVEWHDYNSDLKRKIEKLKREIELAEEKLR